MSKLKFLTHPLIRRAHLNFGRSHPISQGALGFLRKQDDPDEVQFMNLPDGHFIALGDHVMSNYSSFANGPVRYGHAALGSDILYTQWHHGHEDDYGTFSITDVGLNPSGEILDDLTINDIQTSLGTWLNVSPQQVRDLRLAGMPIQDIITTHSDLRPVPGAEKYDFNTISNLIGHGIVVGTTSEFSSRPPYETFVSSSNFGQQVVPHTKYIMRPEDVVRVDQAFANDHSLNEIRKIN